MGLFDKTKNVVPMKYRPTRRILEKPFSRIIKGGKKKL